MVKPPVIGASKITGHPSGSRSRLSPRVHWEADSRGALRMGEGQVRCEGHRIYI